MRLFAFVLLLPALSLAQVPHTFNNGEVADAEKINANFGALSSDVSRLQLEVAPEYLISEAVDCSADPAALNKSLSQHAGVHNLELNVSGECLLDESSQAMEVTRQLIARPSRSDLVSLVYLAPRVSRRKLSIS